MQTSILKTLPIGVLLFFLTYLALRRKRSEHSKAASEYPAFARAESLQHNQRRPGEIGVLTGQYRGFGLRVDPDEGAKIWLRFKHRPKVELRTFQFLKRQPPGMEPLLTPFRNFDGYFVERYVSRAVNDVLLEDSQIDLDEWVAELKASPQRILTLSISAEGIECRLAIERVAYISKQTLEYLLPRFVRLATLLDVEHLAGDGSAADADSDSDA